MQDQIKTLGLENNLNVVLWSDHGMEQMYRNQVVNLTLHYDAADVMKLDQTFLELDTGPITTIWPAEGKKDKVSPKNSPLYILQ